MASNGASNQNLNAQLNKLIRDISLERLKGLSKVADVKVAEIRGDPVVLAHWMAFILVSGKSLRVLFKTHFMSNEGKFFASPSYGVSPKDLSSQRVLDFFREYCNVTAGGLKIALDQNNIKVGISLPILARGFDEIFYPKPLDTTIDRWTLICQNQKVFCSAHVTLLESVKIDSQSAKSKDDGDVEFL